MEVAQEALQVAEAVKIQGLEINAVGPADPGDLRSESVDEAVLGVVSGYLLLGGGGTARSPWARRHR